ncbi:MAG: Oligopeptide-binding protein AppA precursor [Syntrophorhabdus sp. PtaU1.Bin153]|nr:MAG: Oligopeptide-binding protein AppA precursor [Syntrophorhabdus sp. PtaU1.Bin153]
MTIQKNLFSIIVIALLLVACSRTKDATRYDDPGKPAYGDTIITGSIGEPSNLIPLLATDQPSHAVAGNIYNGLVKYDKDLNIVGDLAESWEISKDNLSIIFHLRKGVKWHDGRPFTAHDVMYTYKVTVDPKTPTAYAGDFLLVKEAKVIDDYTFKVTYAKPFAPALISWSVAMLPKHLLEGRDITTSPLLRSPLGTGPYIFKEWIAGDRVTLRANPNYFEGRPYIDQYVMRIIPDTGTMFLELKNYGIDMTGLAPLQAVRQTEYPAFRREFNKFKYLAFQYVYLGYNLKHPFFKDKLVRQAISYAIDKREIIDGILLGQGVEATGPFKPDMWAYNGNVKRYDYDREKAVSLLNEAGFTKGSDGVLSRDGKPFEFTILLSQGNDVRIRCAELIQRRLSEIGIQVKIRVIEWASFINQFIDKRNFEAVILGWSIPQDPDLFDIWHSSKQGPKELNFISFENKEVDDLLVKARHTLNQEERKRSIYRIQEILAEEQPYTFLFVPYANVAIHKRFKGIVPAAAGLEYDFIKWYVPENQRRYKTHATVSP